MSPNKRDAADGFDGRYPANDSDWAERAYREAGMEPPWLLQYKDGKVVGPAKREQPPAPRHEA
ncbi:hypothetical protein [Leifsonia sp. TF02-11]|uniref:hypothetical protein n=1 Tax=Leifsonia sp. TF02-11 TaxID=2815212 RepID=UPI001AA0D603|nr:hypothetical protein [Leifsonia sp. TF02-11]MBO1739713.1 hypothetical protein [Leifsonia sp. TF02-11]